MSTGFDVGAEFVHGVADRAGVWRFIAGFAAHWISPLADADGWSEADLVAAEENLGVRLPSAMRKAYRLFGRREDLTGNQDFLLSPAHLDLDETGEMLVFRVENQGVWEWGVSMADPYEPDPRVAIRLSGDDPEQWGAWLDRFLLACVEMVLSESLYSAVHISEPLSADDLARVERMYSRLPIPECHVFADDSGIRWFAGQDVLLRVDPADCLGARARTAEALDRLRRSFPENWAVTENL
ncbi:SMI1/KNR4 family protein [Nocardia brevicatena]|uniref:SMI1/KNR4 family protein n=1 Tax=Nocardia brevicatena TaxID=37327 RepID=UPI0005953704|nr:SMI1/KNR4 family protein [Nocardia brevicatena]